MTTSSIPLIDMNEWTHGDRSTVAHEVDDALRTSGFLLLANHGIDSAAADGLRTAASAFFSQPTSVKARYETTVGGRGWIPDGQEANFFDGDDPGTPDLKESFAIGRDHSTGDSTLDGFWFSPNIWPTEVPELRKRATDYMNAAYRVYDELLRMCATSLGLGSEWFVERTSRGSRTLKINRYPALTETGAPEERQFRIAPHTDWSIFTLLNREAGYGGFQIEYRGEWVDAPFVENALVVNIGDLMARWTGNRWKSTRHRVLPPQSQAPTEELISLIMFCDANVDTLIEPLPVGEESDLPPIEAGENLRRRALSANVG